MAKPAAVQNEEQLVDINTADAKTLEQQLEGIGPKKATAIIEYREKHGLFKSLSDLEQVYGIGEKTLARNRDKIKIVIPHATETTTQEHSSLPANPTAVAEEKSPTAETAITDQTAPPTQETNSALKGEEF
ncbi:MAG: ComEA family DNA-binding protein [Thioploca sp.]|nr:ComEA family DNA-binding protein [Thioploca sp.]